MWDCSLWQVSISSCQCKLNNLRCLHQFPYEMRNSIINYSKSRIVQIKWNHGDVVTWKIIRDQTWPLLDYLRTISYQISVPNPDAASWQRYSDTTVSQNTSILPTPSCQFGCDYSCWGFVCVSPGAHELRTPQVSCSPPIVYRMYISPIRTPQDMSLSSLKI